MRVLAGLLSVLVVASAASVKAASVKSDTSLRTGCYSDSDRVAELAKGTVLTIRSAIAGESIPCYKVAAEVGGKRVEGYLAGPAIEGLELFDKARRDARWPEISQILSAMTEQLVQEEKRAAPSAINVSARGGVAREAVALIEGNQPSRALALLEPEVKKRRDPGLLAMAGVAAWRSDDSARALDYWRESLDLQRNPDLEELYKRVARENAGDKSGERLVGMRVQLRYEGLAIPAETARQMVAVLDQEFTRISGELGCSATERVVAVAQSPAAYRQTTNAAEWSGGQFDGKIRVPVFDPRTVDGGLRRTLAHEIAHACMSLLGRWPSWLQEGVAQRVSGETLEPGVRTLLASMASQGKLPKLGRLGQDWSGLDSQHAMLAYGMSLMAVEILQRDYGSTALRNLFQNPERLATITVDLDRRMGL